MEEMQQFREVEFRNVELAAFSTDPKESRVTLTLSKDVIERRVFVTQILSQEALHRVARELRKKIYGTKTMNMTVNTKTWEVTAIDGEPLEEFLSENEDSLCEESYGTFALSLTDTHGSIETQLTVRHEELHILCRFLEELDSVSPENPYFAIMLKTLKQKFDAK
jgi:hypothetical protein